MEIEQDPYSFIKYINLMNTNNDGYGSPKIPVFVEMGVLTMNEKLLCTINNTPYECYIDKNNDDQYVLSYQSRIQDSNVMKFIIKLSKLIKIKIICMGNAFERIRRAIDNRTLTMVDFELKRKYEEPLTNMLLNCEFGIWEIHTSFNFDEKKFKFICKSNMKYKNILKIINNNNHSDIDIDTYRNKQQLYSLLKHDAIQIIYQPKTNKDIFKLDNGTREDGPFYTILK